MGETEFRALVKRAQEIDRNCKKNSQEMEALKTDLVEFKKGMTGEKKIPKKKSLWEHLLGDGEEEKESTTEEES